MLSSFQPLPVLAVLTVLLCFAAAPVQAQMSADAFKSVLRDQGAFTSADLATVENGQVVAKLLKVKDKREVAVCGVVGLQVPRDVFLQFTRDNVAQLNNRAILQIGKFSSSPTIEDLQSLTLENRDIEDLKRCTVGNCSVKMSAAMIEHLRNEVDWAAPDYRVQATLVFRQLLLDYVRDYLARGTPALMEYSDRTQGVRVEEEQRSLLDASIYFNQFAPEFTQYLRSFPQPPLGAAENSLFWSKIKFGLKPVITVTHVVIYSRPARTAPQVLVASRQIYANHYFDSSLALSAFINPSVDGGTGNSYLLYTNRSRADALGGMFSGLKRALVESEAMGSLQAILQEQKLRMEALTLQSGSTTKGETRLTGEESFKWSQYRFGGLHLLWWVLMIISLAVVLWLIRRHSRRQSPGTS